MKTCKECGFLIEDYCKFCTHCGAKQEAMDKNVENIPVEPVPLASYSTDMLKPAASSKKGLILGIIGTAIMFTGLVSFTETFLLMNELFEDTGFRNDLGSNPEILIPFVYTFMGLIFSGFAIVAILLGGLGIRMKTPWKASKIFSGISIGGGILLLVIIFMVCATKVK